MIPLFDDPAELKFVNGKFILSTNDPKNPVRTIRQLEKNNTNSVVISMTDGQLYDDRLETLQDLISTTSNRAWDCTIMCTFGFAVYGSEKDPSIFISQISEAVKSLKKFQFKSDQYFLKTSRMIPERILYQGIQIFIGDFRDVSWSRVYSSGGKILFKFTLISPPDPIGEILEEMRKDFQCKFRDYTNAIPGVYFDDRNATGYYAEGHLDDAINSMKESPKNGLVVSLIFDKTDFLTESKLFLKKIQTNLDGVIEQRHEGDMCEI